MFYIKELFFNFRPLIHVFIMNINFEGIKVTSEVLWRAAVIFALFDIVLVTYLARFIEPAWFRKMKWPVTAITGIIWFLIWLAMVIFFWEPVYHYVFPSWSRWLLPFLFGMGFALVGLLFWWLAQQFKGNPVINFCLLGGLWGMITHIVAIHRGILEKPPLLQGISPVSASIMPIFEFVFYWCIILGLAKIWQRRSDEKNSPTDRSV
jgi:hypothetical protein